MTEQGIKSTLGAVASSLGLLSPFSEDPLGAIDIRKMVEKIKSVNPEALQGYLLKYELKLDKTGCPVDSCK